MFSENVKNSIKFLFTYYVYPPRTSLQDSPNVFFKKIISKISKKQELRIKETLLFTQMHFQGRQYQTLICQITWASFASKRRQDTIILHAKSEANSVVQRTSSLIQFEHFINFVSSKSFISRSSGFQFFSVES